MLSELAQRLAMMMAIVSLVGGCRATRGPFHARPVAQAVTPSASSAEHMVRQASAQEPTEPEVNEGSSDVPPELPLGVEGQQREESSAEIVPVPPADPASDKAPDPLAVISSVRNHFPLLQEAQASRIVASGEALAASGAFDRRLDGYSNAQPLDYYENNWHKWGLTRNTMWGGEVGAGYRLGRGSFEPWYKERETNDLGELGVSLSVPVGRDWAIDANRAELWRAQLERNRVEPMIRAQLIMSVRDGLQTYWEWVAAHENQRIAEEVLQLALDRTTYLERQVELGEKADIDVVDNRRIVVSRQSILTATRQKLAQATVKLSLYLRDAGGAPLLLAEEVDAPGFPLAKLPETFTFESDIALASANRPELAELAVVRRQLGVAVAQARNETRADVDAGLFVGQDIGAATPARDKSETELEATLTVAVPLERRNALGKLRQLRGKLAQLEAKTRYASDKIAAEVQIARAAVMAAAERVEQNSEALELTQRMQEAEQRLYEEGQGTLFNLNLREQQRAEAAATLVASQLDFFIALADYTAALGLDGVDLEVIYADAGAP